MIVKSSIPLKRIDLEELKKQKDFLLSSEAPEAEGLLSIVDAIQDYCVDVLGIAEELVFNNQP